MLNKIFKFIKNVDLNDQKNEIQNFIIDFNENLQKIGIDYDTFYNKNYAFVDFNKIFKNKLKYLKKLNLNFEKFLFNFLIFDFFCTIFLFLIFYI